MKTLIVEIEDESHKKLKMLALKEDKTISELIRKEVDRLVSKEKGVK